MQPNQIQSLDNIIESDFHTLFIKEYPEEYLPLTTEDGQLVEGIFEHVPAQKVYKLFLQEFSDESIHGWNKIIDTLQEASYEDVLELHISGPGGVVREGMELYHIIDSKFRGRTTAFLNYGYSMNALVFLFADQRIIYDASDFMLHSYSGGTYGKRDDMLTQINHTDKHLRRFTDKILEPYLTKKEIKAMNAGKDFWFGPWDMLKRGIATHIIVNGGMLEAKDYFERYNKKGKLKKSWRKKLEKEQEKDINITKVDNTPE